MNANKKLKMMTTKEQSSPASSVGSEMKPAANESDNTVTPESNAWETMQRWKKEIVTPGSDSFFEEKVPKFLTESKVTTVQQIKNESIDKEWLGLLAACGVNTVFLEKKLQTVKFTREKHRMVPVDYKIAESELSHTIDLEALHKKVEETFDWYDPKSRTFVAPYFPLIQSSGMGKTKLLYELSLLLKKSVDTTCFLCLSGAIDVGPNALDATTNEIREVFHPRLDFRNVVADIGSSEDPIDVKARIAAENVMTYLDKFFLSCQTKRLVLLFDEAQVLLTKQYNVHAFVFQCIRLWLRQESRPFESVALFSGTTASLANFFPDESIVSIISSRMGIKDKVDIRKFLPSGRELPPPFFQTTTIGCLTYKSKGKSDTVTQTDYDHAVPYGRPLFAKMAESSSLENRLDTVLSRMLLIEEDSRKKLLKDDTERNPLETKAKENPSEKDFKWNWESNKESCLSILATRVQMGQTSTEIASRLVSKGYANLVGFSTRNVAEICYHTDPVCAHLAMAIMDENWSMEVIGSNICGKDKIWWVQQAAESFSGGLCRPNKGDVGEIFVALYLLRKW